MMRRWFWLWWIVGLSVMPASAAEVQLTWDAVTTNADGSAITDLAGYTVHQGVSPGMYQQSTVVGLTTRAIVGGLSAGTYVFAVTAFDTSGHTSDYSNEVTATITTTSQTLVLSPTADTYLNLDKINYRIEPTLHTYTWPDFKVANAILLKFNLSALPSHAVLESAVLSLWQVDSDRSGSAYRISAHQVIGVNPNLNQATGYRASSAKAWKANGCCDQKIPMAQANIGPAVDAQDLDSALTEKTWLVTDIIDAWRTTPTKNFGLLLNSDARQPRDRYRAFASQDHPMVARRPSLTLTYTMP